MTSSNHPPAAVAVAANHTATTATQAQDQIEKVIKLFEFEEDSKSKAANIPSSSPQEDSFALFGIHDSLTLKKYKNIQKLVRDDFFDGDDELDMIDIEQEVDKAMEADHDADLASCPLSGSSPRRRGERRGQPHNTAEPTTTSESLIVMTKTHDGSSRDRGTLASGFIVIHNASEVGSSLHNASAA